MELFAKTRSKHGNVCKCVMCAMHNARLLAHLEDEVVPKHKVGNAGYKDEDGREDSSPQENDAVGLWQFHQVSDLEASDVIYRKECEQGLQAAHSAQLHSSHAGTNTQTNFMSISHAISCQGHCHFGIIAWQTVSIVTTPDTPLKC